MNLSKLTPTVLGILLTALPIHAVFAKGGTDGGGGGAMVKTDKRGKIRSELIDLWEARSVPRKWDMTSSYILDVQYSSQSVDAQIERALDKLRDIDPFFAELVEKNLEYVRNQANWYELPDDVSLPLPKDANLVYESSEGKPTGMFYFDDTLSEGGMLSVKKKIYKGLINNTNIAAAFTHEAIYKTMRDMKFVDGDSSEVRMINACLYSNDDCFGLRNVRLQPISGAQFYTCSSAQNKNVPLVVEKDRRPIQDAGIEYYSATLQLTQLGSKTFKVPYNVYFGLSRYNNGEFYGQATGIKSRAFELYMRRWNSWAYNLTSGDTGMSASTTVISTGTTGVNLTQFTIPQFRLTWNDEYVPEQTFKCVRVK